MHAVMGGFEHVSVFLVCNDVIKIGIIEFWGRIFLHILNNPVLKSFYKFKFQISISINTRVTSVPSLENLSIHLYCSSHVSQFCHITL